MVGTGRGAQMGILIKGPEILEQTRRVDTIVLDKTGTVTEGKMELVEVALLNGATRAEVLRLAGAVEAASEHPIAAGRRVRPRGRRSASCRRSRRSATTPASASSGSSKATRSRSARRDGRIEVTLGRRSRGRR